MLQIQFLILESQKKKGFDIDKWDEQIKRGLGYDHFLVLNNQNSGTRFAASIYDLF